ncbi:MAG: SDR family NAD(P)-dependent oxidoreductase, partial [Alcaligenes pakistanensis]
MSDFVGRIAIVTGAAAGIGQAVCQHLLELGAIVGGIDRQPEGIPQGVTPLIADVTDQESLN